MAPERVNKPVIVKLQCETAQFQSDLGKVKHELAGLKGGSDIAGTAIVTDMTKSRETVVLLGEEFGVKMPRALSMLISRLPAVASAMQYLYPVVGAVAMLAIITKLVTEFEKLAADVIKASNAVADYTIKTDDSTSSLELSNMQLDDQIANLEGGPTHNALAEAMLKTGIAADNLASRFATDFQKIEGDVVTAQEAFNRLWDTVVSGKGVLRVVSDLMFGTTTILGGMAHGTAELKNLSDAMQSVDAARVQMAESADKGMFAQAAAQDNYIHALRAQEAAAKAAYATTNGETAADIKLRGEDTQVILGSVAAIRQLNLEQQEGAKRSKIAGMKEDIHNAQLAVKITEAQTAATKAHDAALMHEAQTQMMGGMAAARGGQSPDAMLAASRAAAQAQRDEDIQTAQQTLAAETNVYEAKRRAAEGNVNELKVLAIDYLASKQAFNDAEVNANLQMNERISVANAAYERLEATHEKMLTAQHRRELQNRLQDTIVTDQQKIQAAKDAASGHISHLHTQASAGVISKQAEQEGILAILHKEQADMKAMYAKEIADKKSYADQMKALEKASVGTSNEAGAIANATHAQDAYSAAVEKAAKDQQALNNQLFATNAALAQMRPSWSNVADQMRKDLPTLGKETSDLSMQFEHGLNQSIAQAIVSGKDFGQSMQQVFGSLTTGIIGYILQYIELAAVQAIAKNIGGGAGGNTGKEIAKNKAMQMSEAQLAGAKAMATTPFPMDLVIGPAVFAAAMAFAKGGIVPGSGSGDTVPAMLTPGESVLPKAMTQNLSRASGGMTIHNHNNYSPQIHAIDATGVDGMLTKHGAVFQRHIAAQMRRMNQ